jgi:hypothetical protein
MELQYKVWKTEDIVKLENNTQRNTEKIEGRNK